MITINHYFYYYHLILFFLFQESSCWVEFNSRVNYPIKQAPINNKYGWWHEQVRCIMVYLQGSRNWNQTSYFQLEQPCHYHSGDPSPFWVISAWITFTRAPPFRLFPPKTAGIEELPGLTPYENTWLRCPECYSAICGAYEEGCTNSLITCSEVPSIRWPILNRPASFGQKAISPNSSLRYNEFAST